MTDIDSLISALQKGSPGQVNQEYLLEQLKSAFDVGKLIQRLAETTRLPSDQVLGILKENGMGKQVLAYQMDVQKGSLQGEGVPYQIQSNASSRFSQLFDLSMTPGFDLPVIIPELKAKALPDLLASLATDAKTDHFAYLFRGDVMGYHDQFIKGDGARMLDYLAGKFSPGTLRNVVTTGIGANEMASHYVSRMYNSDPASQMKWIVATSPGRLNDLLPPDATTENTVFLEFSRSGDTQETVKIHEITPREMVRVIFANKGPLKDLGLRDNNLVLSIPDEVAGRYGRNKTPILLAPMLVAGMDTAAYWTAAEDAILGFNLSDSSSLPWSLALYTMLYQEKNKINGIYLGVNDPLLACLGHELLQFWNEGMNKDGNDILMATQTGMPRDSHAGIEAYLSNASTKMAIYLALDRVSGVHPLIRKDINPLLQAHKGLDPMELEYLFTLANARRMEELMPTVQFRVRSPLQLAHSAVLGQLFADFTYCYARLMGIDPGSNPHVKGVRNTTADMLTMYASKT